MDYKEIIKTIEPKLQKIQESLKTQLSEIRVGNIGVALIESVKVNCFGQELSLKQISIVSSHSPKEILVHLWDKSYMEAVVQAIERRKMDLGVRTEENNIFLSFPPLTEESKKNLIKVLRDKKEENYQSIRRLRDYAWKEMQEDFHKGEIREDDKYRGKKELEDLIKKYKDKMEQDFAKKQKEIEG